MMIIKKLIPILLAAGFAAYEAYGSIKQEDTIEELKNRVEELEKDEDETKEEEES